MKRHSLLRAALLLAFVSVSAFALPILDRQITVNLYQVCDDNGQNCASTGTASDPYFMNATSTVWAQAGIHINFHVKSPLNKTAWYDVSDPEFDEITGSQGHYLSTSVIDAFFTHSLLSEGYLLGLAWVGRGGLVLAMDPVMSLAPNGYLSTFAHEIGHNLSLDHTVVQNDHYLMNAVAPNDLTSVSDIAPTGGQYAYLSAGEITQARSSSLVTAYTAAPEPLTWLSTAGGTIVFAMLRRRRQFPLN